MRVRLMRALGTLVTAGALVGGMITAAAPAGAVEPGIHKPSLTVVCGQPHHGNYFSAARFAQHGRWAAAGKVSVTITRINTAHPAAVLHTRTGAHGWFHLRRTLNGDEHPAWIAGARYTWTTSVYGKTWAVARRGSVTLTGSC
jgi:hypothetical protein